MIVNRFDYDKKRNTRSSRAGSFFLCRQRKKAKRPQRGESCLPPFETPYKGRCGGSSKEAREVCRLKMSGSARSTRRHTSVVSLIQIFTLSPLENPTNGFYKKKDRAGAGARSDRANKPHQQGPNGSVSYRNCSVPVAATWRREQESRFGSVADM